MTKKANFSAQSPSIQRIRCARVAWAPKNTLGTGDSVTKSIKQLIEAKDDFEAWFASEGLQHWRYIPMIYAEGVVIEINCLKCIQYVMKGTNDHIVCSVQFHCL